MHYVLYLLAGFALSLAVGLYRMRDRLGPFVCEAMDDTPRVDFYYHPDMQNYTYQTHGNAIVTVHQVTDGDGNPYTGKSSATIQA